MTMNCVKKFKPQHLKTIDMVMTTQFESMTKLVLLGNDDGTRSTTTTIDMDFDDYQRPNQFYLVMAMVLGQQQQQQIWIVTTTMLGVDR